jgi:taurine--2-oxoglutarate transaminase
MNGQEMKEQDLQYNLHSWSKQGNLNPIPVAKSAGIYFWDTEGKRYTDMSSQLVNMNLGHGNQAIIKAIQDQAQKLCFIAPSYAVESRSILAKMVIELLPDNMGKVFFYLRCGKFDRGTQTLPTRTRHSGICKIF